jgi:shikimate dehydrogenase
MNAVIGKPIKHSMSPVLHNKMYRLLGIESELIKDEDESIANLVERIKQTPYELTAVTMPYKQDIIPLLDEIDVDAKEIGSINTVINIDGILKGYNTDIYGIEYSLRDIDIENKNVLIIGAGGVARTVMYVIKKMRGNIMCANRTIEQAESLVEEFGGKVVQLEEVLPENVDIIINTTSVGMYPDIDMSLVPKEFLQSKHTVFDIVYNPIQTKFLLEAEEIGAKIISGLDMFIAQGIRQIELWQDINIDIGEHKKNIKTLLTKNV